MKIVNIAWQTWHLSLARELSGTIKEILGSAQSVGCSVDGYHPPDINSGAVEWTTDKNISIKDHLTTEKKKKKNVEDLGEAIPVSNPQSQPESSPVVLKVRFTDPWDSLRTFYGVHTVKTVFIVIDYLPFSSCWCLHWWCKGQWCMKLLES